jgi:peptidoglycan L-alanyl-D-glutamate endopeptidase CwlK
MASRDIKDLSASLQPIAQDFIDQCADQGIIVKLICTYRSNEEQDVDYAQGRTAAGKIITELKGGQSAHNCVDSAGNPAAQAFDFGVFESDGTYVSSGADPRYHQAGTIGESLGMTWGGEWHHPVDLDHFETKNWRTNT